MMIFKRLALFFLKDLRIFLSYKGSILNQLFVLLFAIYIIFSFTQIPEIKNLKLFEDMGIDLFSFLFIGLIFTDTAIRVLVSLPSMIRSYQTIGILEELFHISDNKEIEMIFLNNVYTLTLCFFRAGILYLLFFYLDGFPTVNQVFMSLIIFSLHIIAMYGIGLLCASYSLLFRQNNVLQSFFILGITFFSNAFIPNEAFSSIIQNLSVIFPSTHSIEAVRHLFSDGDLVENFYLIQTLFFESIIYVIMGITALKASIHISKKYGSINFF